MKAEDFKKGDHVRHIHTGEEFIVLGPFEGVFAGLNITIKGKVRVQSITNPRSKETEYDPMFLAHQ